MSYVRFGEDGSNVYIYMSTTGLQCCGCTLAERRAYDNTEDMVTHLHWHIVKGDVVPDYVIPSLREDDDMNFPWKEEGVEKARDTDPGA